MPIKLKIKKLEFQGNTASDQSVKELIITMIPSNHYDFLL